MPKGRRPLTEIFSANMKAARERMGISQESLGQQLGVQRAYVSRLERGQNVTLDTLDKIASVLAVDPLALLARPTIRSSV